MSRLIVAHSTVRDGSMLNRDETSLEQAIAHREKWLSSVGVPIEQTYRIILAYAGRDDFCRYREVSNDDVPANSLDGDNVISDALITTRPGVALFLPLADCIGAVFHDEEHGVLMMSHLGRHSLEQNGGVKSVQHLVKHYGTDPAKLKVWLSAAIGKNYYKIFKLDNKGMKEVLHEQLAEAGVTPENIQDTDHDTGTHEAYYSYSEFLKGNKPENGRHAIVAMMAD